MDWYVLITRPHHELKLEERLIQKGYTVYCPKERTVRQWSDRKKRVTIPLIPRAVFIQIEAPRRDEVFSDQSVVKYLFEHGRPAVVRAEEIEILRQVEQGKSGIGSAAGKPGDRIDLSQLALPVSSGIIHKVSRNYILVRLSELNMQVKLEI